jgi:hypothetical protein
MKHIKKFNEKFLDIFKSKKDKEREKLFSTKDLSKPSEDQIREILAIQGKQIDQRDIKKIYTRKDLESMGGKEVSSIWRKILHPKGRNW